MEDLVTHPRYKEFFETLSSNNNYNITIPAPSTAKELDEPIAATFPQWNTVPLKCLVQSCGDMFYSPLDLLKHKKESHPDFREKFIECPLCDPDTSDRPKYFFSQFINHVYEKHSPHFRYW